jgi:hypothetical protein
MTEKEKEFEVSYSVHELWHVRVRAFDEDQARQLVETGDFDEKTASRDETEISSVNLVEEVP